MNASTEKFAGINLLPWNVKSPAGRWLWSMQPAPPRHAPTRHAALAFEGWSSLTGERSASARFSSWIKPPHPGKGRSLLNPSWLHGQPPPRTRAKQTVQKSPCLGPYVHRCPKEPLYSPTCVCGPRSFPTRQSSTARVRVFSNITCWMGRFLLATGFKLNLIVRRERR